MSDKCKPLTQKEVSAIEEVKLAIRNLPRNIHIELDTDDGVMTFLKCLEPGVSMEMDTLRRKQAFQNNMRRN